MSIAFNYGFLALWFTEYGEREGMKRYMSDFEVDPNARSARAACCRRRPPVAAPPA